MIRYISRDQKKTLRLGLVHTQEVEVGEAAVFQSLRACESEARITAE